MESGRSGGPSAGPLPAVAGCVAVPPRAHALEVVAVPPHPLNQLLDALAAELPLVFGDVSEEDLRTCVSRALAACKRAVARHSPALREGDVAPLSATHAAFALLDRGIRDGRFWRDLPPRRGRPWSEVWPPSVYGALLAHAVLHPDLMRKAGFPEVGLPPGSADSDEILGRGAPLVPVYSEWSVALLGPRCGDTPGEEKRRRLLEAGWWQMAPAAWKDPETGQIDSKMRAAFIRAMRRAEAGALGSARRRYAGRTPDDVHLSNEPAADRARDVGAEVLGLGGPAPGTTLLMPDRRLVVSPRKVRDALVRKPPAGESLGIRSRLVPDLAHAPPVTDLPATADASFQRSDRRERRDPTDPDVAARWAGAAEDPADVLEALALARAVEALRRRPEFDDGPSRAAFRALIEDVPLAVAAREAGHGRKAVRLARVRILARARHELRGFAA
jgi:hypothetical protein